MSTVRAAGRARLRIAAATMAEQGWVVVDQFLPAAAVEALRRDALDLDLSGEFRTASVGRGAERSVDPDVRSDRLCWIDPDSTSPPQTAYLQAMAKLRETLNRELFLSLVNLEAHYAIYPPGAHYSRHTDRFRSSDERMISCSLYLNQRWTESMGGVLRIYDANDAAHDVLPIGGRIVLFRSDVVPHEVLPSTEPRLSLTGWFRRRSLNPFSI